MPAQEAAAQKLEVRDLVVEYGVGRRRYRAVDGVSFSVPRNHTLGLVGESGCGKTSSGMAILRLIPARGRVLWEGRDLFGIPLREYRPYRRRIQVIFQNPDSSLNPRLTVGRSLDEALELGHPESRRDWPDLAAQKMRLVGLDPDTARRYPHEFSGGQLQRIGIARALCVEPEFIICDEPVSSLDVSIQAQILNLLMDLQDDLGLGYLFISHDLAVVKHIAHQVAVMAGGRIRELDDTETVFSHPRSETTRQLLAAIPGGGA